MSIFKFLKNKLKIGRVATILLGVVIFSFFVFGFFKDAKSPYVLAQSGTDSQDAIAVRIMPNPNHYSIARWYSGQKFKGSPQVLTVDGYEALRDGRTIYVSVANIAKNGAGEDQLYTNIYLISYNQNAGGDTTSILDQLIAHWKFNTEKTTPGNCNKTIATVCLIDADCPNGQYCNSEKARITRDTKRLGELADMKTAVENYKGTKGYYPKLSAGTYLVGKTVSTWPSWQQTFAKDLGTSLPIDPINKLGACKAPEDKNYNSATCWSEKDKLFAGATLTDGTLELPADSNAFVYTATSNGSKYNVCGVMESGLVKTLAAGACAGSAVGSARSYSGSAANNDPVITCGSLVGNPGKAFKGYISASDPDGDALPTWSIDTNSDGEAGTLPAAWLSGTLTGATNQKEISGTPTAGVEKKYYFRVTVNDDRGGTKTEKCYINIIGSALPVVTPIPDKEIVIGKTLDFTIYASDSAGKYPLVFNFPPSSLNCKTVENNRNCHVSQVIGTSFNSSPEGTDNPISVSVANSAVIYSLSQSFNLKVINHKPVITKPLGCAGTIRTGSSYNCDIKATDLDKHDISFSFSGLPAGITGDASTGVISGIPTAGGTNNISITATDQYGSASNPESFTLNVKTFCGDNAWQATNGEGGSEECDGSDKAGKDCTNAYPAGQFTGGTLGCDSSCKFNSSQCVNTFKITGNVKDYMTAGPLDGATVEVRKASDNTLVKTTNTDASGNYTLADVPALADYKVVVSNGSSYANGDSGVFNLTADKVVDFVLSGSGLQGAARFQLMWGSSPADLDSHLTFDSTHIYYLNVSGGDASLDADDTNGNGPENIRIQTLLGGATYRYFIHDFTNKNNCSGASFNGANVEVYNSGGVKVKTYSSTHIGNCFWYVFSMDDKGKITDENSYTDVGVSSSK